VTFFHALLLGALQGITEFLPVSSTAHLLVAQRLLGYDDPGGVFTVTIQFGSILAVMWLYRVRLTALLVSLPTRPLARRFALAVLVAFLPALVAGASLAGFVKTVLYVSPRVIGAALVLGGIVMLVVERWRPQARVAAAEGTSLRQALGIGVCQTLALVPGVSRSGATIVGGMLMGLDRAAAAEFSFFLAMPTMMAALVYDLVEIRPYLTSERGLEIAIGFVTAFVASAVVVKPFLRYVGRSGFGPFAWYRIVAGVTLLGALAAGWE
jgi:undecaprenyl-diphosphatase